MNLQLFFPSSFKSAVAGSQGVIFANKIQRQLNSLIYIYINALSIDFVKWPIMTLLSSIIIALQSAI